MPAPSPIYGVSVDPVALAAGTPKTVLEIATPTTTGIVPIMLWVEFDGVSAAAVPVKVEIGLFSAGATAGTAVTPFPINFGERGIASQVAAKAPATTEGAGTPTYVETHRVSPTAGIVLQEPLGNEWSVGVSSFFRIRCTAAAGVNACVGMRWAE